MSMVTSCPACTTTFRITPEQLKQREGRVRCGKCSGVFDAFKTLASLPDQPAGDASEPITDADHSVRPAEVSRDESSGPSGTGAPMQGQVQFDSGSSAMPGTSAMPAPADAEVRTSQRRRGLWAGGIVILAIALLLQLLYAFRDQVAAAWPSARPALEQVCAKLGCVVSLPKRTDQIAIESSDLQTDPKRPNTLILTAAVRNRGSALVAHPSIELTLTDGQDQAVARRVFQPADYLADASAAKGGMAGMSEVNVRITLDTGDLKPAGYRLFLFYP